MKWRTAVIGLCFHLVVSGVLWGGLCVYQRCYNTMHRDQIPVASVTVSDHYAEIQLLEENCTIPIDWLNENALSYASYALSAEPLRIWGVLLDFVSRNIL